MSVSTIEILAYDILSNVPIAHWGAMGALSIALMVYVLIRKKCSVYGAIALGLTVFMGLFLLDSVVVIRTNDLERPETGISLTAEYQRLIHGGYVRWTEMLANVAVFVPFGFFLTEFLKTTQCEVRRRLCYVTLSALGLSLCIESFQLIFRLGVFEVTDLALNTLGGFVGACLAIIGRKLWERIHVLKHE